jgi:hypothetical protein
MYRSLLDYCLICAFLDNHEQSFCILEHGTSTRPVSLICLTSQPGSRLRTLDFQAKSSSRQITFGILPSEIQRHLEEDEDLSHSDTTNPRAHLPRHFRHVSIPISSCVAIELLETPQGFNHHCIVPIHGRADGIVSQTYLEASKLPSRRHGASA